MVAWMLTPDDKSTDGKFVSYLKNSHKWSRYDANLFEQLRDLLTNREKRQVSIIEGTELLPNAEYFSAHVPDSSSGRITWFESLSQRAQGSDLVFLDPDNGLEVKSKPYGRKDSSKFLYWREVEALWSSGKSLLIYQHFIREERFKFIQRMLGELRARTPGSLVEAFSTPHVLFLTALQPMHQCFHVVIIDSVQKNWKGQIQHWELTRAQQAFLP